MAMPNTYRSIAHDAYEETVIQRSQFLAAARAVTNEEQALAFIADERAKYPDASCTTYAYIADMLGIAQRFSDGGELSGSAGMPMLEVIKKRGLCAVVVVVTRYFGGTKLGAGGLLRAFAGAAANVLEQAGIVLYERSVRYEANISYAAQGRIEYALRHSPYALGHIEYGAQLSLDIDVRLRDEADFLLDMAQWSNANAALVRKAEHYRPWDTA